MLEKRYFYLVSNSDVLFVFVSCLIELSDCIFVSLVLGMFGILHVD